MQNTALQFSEVISQCRDLFSKKLQDYGAAWRVLRPSSIIDQIYIKVNIPYPPTPFIQRPLVIPQHIC